MSSELRGPDRLERVTIRLYSRLGAPVVRVYLAVLLGAQFVTGLLAAVAVARYLRMTADERVELILVTEGTIVLVLVVVALLCRAPTQALLEWSGDGRSRARAVPAWDAVAAYPGAVTRRCGTVAAAVVGPLSYFAVVNTDEPAWALAPVALGGLLALAGGLVLLRFALEFVLRPLLEDIATFLPADFEPARRSWPVRVKVLAPVPVLIVFAAVGIGAFADLADPGPGRIALTCAIGALVAAGGTLVFVAVIRSALDPINDLTSATERVRAGDLSTPVAVVTADDLGGLSASFNRMLDGLREREALREEVLLREEELRLSRARIVEASDAERRRVERNIHDGAQQRLVAVAIKLRVLEEQLADDPPVREAIGAAGEQLKTALEELRELARGLHPAILSTDGLLAAIEQAAERTELPVTIECPEERFPEAVESTAYFVACEALANVSKYAKASSVDVSVTRRNGELLMTISDDGIGGANPDAGSGITGLHDRVAALDGRLTIDSSPGKGTTVTAEIPLT